MHLDARLFVVTIAVLIVAFFGIARWLNARKKLQPVYVPNCTRGIIPVSAPHYVPDFTHRHVDLGDNGHRSRANRLGPHRRHNMRCHGAPMGRIPRRGRSAVR